MGKMISPQSLVVACAATGMVGEEGSLLRFTLKHSLVLLGAVCVIVYVAGLLRALDDPALTAAGAPATAPGAADRFGVASARPSLRRSAPASCPARTRIPPCLRRPPNSSWSFPSTTRRTRSFRSSPSGARSSRAPSAPAGSPSSWSTTDRPTPPRRASPASAGRSCACTATRTAGHGQSCLAGYIEAARMGAPYLFQIDSDGQCDPAGFARVWERRRNAPAIYGRRMTRDDGLARRVISRVLRASLKVARRTRLNDTNVPVPPLRRAPRGGHGEANTGGLQPGQHRHGAPPRARGLRGGADPLSRPDGGAPDRAPVGVCTQGAAVASRPV